MTEQGRAHNISQKQRTEDVIINENVDFAGLLLSPTVLSGLSACGFERPSPIQLKAIPLGRCGLDLVVQAKSGTGKTCVFAVIALESLTLPSNNIQVLVLAPTREIAVQIQQVIQAIGCALPKLRCHTFIGGIPLNEDREKLKKCHIAVGTPGRIKQLIEEKLIRTDSVRLFVMDEADKLMEQNFQEQINWIFWTLPENKQMLVLSATYSEALAKLLTQYMRSPTLCRLNTTDPALMGIRQFFYKVDFHPLPQKSFEIKLNALIHILSSVTFQQCLVFSNYQLRAESLSAMLNAKGWPSTHISGSQDQQHRLEAMNKLKKLHCRVLVTTDLTSRGIDAEHVNMVINLDLPWDHETYLHRIGRAGRFGTYGVAISLVSDGKEYADLKTVQAKCNTRIRPLPVPLPEDLLSQRPEVDPFLVEEICFSDFTDQQMKEKSAHSSRTDVHETESHKLVWPLINGNTTERENSPAVLNVIDPENDSTLKDKAKFGNKKGDQCETKPTAEVGIKREESNVILTCAEITNNSENKFVRDQSALMQKPEDNVLPSGVKENLCNSSEKDQKRKNGETLAKLFIAFQNRYDEKAVNEVSFEEIQQDYDLFVKNQNLWEKAKKKSLNTFMVDRMTNKSDSAIVNPEDVKYILEKLHEGPLLEPIIEAGNPQNKVYNVHKIVASHSKTQENSSIRNKPTDYTPDDVQSLLDSYVSPVDNSKQSKPYVACLAQLPIANGIDQLYSSGSDPSTESEHQNLSNTNYCDIKNSNGFVHKGSVIKYCENGAEAGMPVGGDYDEYDQSYIYFEKQDQLHKKVKASETDHKSLHYKGSVGHYLPQYKEDYESYEKDTDKRKMQSLNPQYIHVERTKVHHRQRKKNKVGNQRSCFMYDSTKAHDKNEDIYKRSRDTPRNHSHQSLLPWMDPYMTQYQWMMQYHMAYHMQTYQSYLAHSQWANYYQNLFHKQCQALKIDDIYIKQKYYMKQMSQCMSKLRR